MSDIRAVIVDDDFAVAHVNRAFVDAQPGSPSSPKRTPAPKRSLRSNCTGPQLVLLDVYLPDLGGLDVLRRLRAAGDDVEVIAVTAARDLDTVRKARLLGVQALSREAVLRGESRRTPRGGAAWHRRRPRTSRAPLDQLAVDQFLGAATGGRASLPKGLSTASLSRVAKCLAECDTDVSAAELAATLGMSRVSARRYLEHLVSTRAAEVAPRYGSAGRPEHRYRMPAGAPG